MNAKKTKPKDFESALERLDEITDLLESGEAKLEDSLSLYTEGLELARYCTSQLNEAEKKIKLITDKNGLPVETDFEVTEED
jgi:exodeoxyribonuclease VII small subunit